MGLDVTAYSKVKRIKRSPGQFDVDLYPKVEGVTAVHHANPSYPLQGAGFAFRQCYSYERSLQKRLGSYSSYNHKRNQLAMLAGWESAEACWRTDVALDNPPLGFLINFSDCEGIINTECSKIIHSELVTLQPKVGKFAQQENDLYFEDWFATLLSVFEVAADGGYVEFH